MTVSVEVFLSRVMRKPAFCKCKNKAEDQLRSNCAAGQRHCFRFTPDIKDKKGIQLHFLENNNKFSHFIYSILCRVNRAIYPLNFTQFRFNTLFVNCKRTG